EAAEFVLEIFGSFEFNGIELVAPTKTFDDHLTVTVGTREVELIEVGPAHTRGDVLVHVPKDRTVFTGDILFIGGHPIVWEGPVSNWIRACERIEAMDVETVVPGHGPMTDKAGVASVRGYLEYLQEQARRRFDAGMDVEQAARDIAMDAFSGWGEAERVAVNVNTLYREFRGEQQAPDAVSMFACMARHACHLRGRS
ncbi:MAG: MBL fold metallo-hydrolase, partial [Nannocystaceae bacterium]